MPSPTPEKIRAEMAETDLHILNPNLSTDEYLRWRNRIRKKCPHRNLSIISNRVDQTKDVVCLDCFKRLDDDDQKRRNL